MLSCRTPLLASLAAAGALAMSAQAAVADAAPAHPSKQDAELFVQDAGGVSCGNSIGDQGQAQSGGVEPVVCGFGLTNVGPTESVTTNVGPAISGPGVAGNVITTAGNVVIVL